MAHVLKDVVTGSVLVAAGLLAGCVFLIAFTIIGIFLHILAILASVLFSLALFMFALWLVGFMYRKMKGIKIP
ncbi:MAG: hypothetical protein ABSC19_06180 [Syntrophorhabdales bacterium]|jgi:hypothetical protein